MSVPCPKLLSMLLTGLCAAVVACSDSSPTAPASAQAAQAPAPQALEKTEAAKPGDLQDMTDRELLMAVLTKLNALEARLEYETEAVYARMDSLASSIVAGADLAGPIAFAKGDKGKKADALAEVSICGQWDFFAKAKVGSTVSIWGGGEGKLGVDAYGNGAQGLVNAFATQEVKVEPSGRGSLIVQICGKANAGVGIENAPQPLRDLLAAVDLPGLSSASTGLGMTGEAVNQAVDVISTFSLADLPFGSGAGSLVNSIPMPPGMRNLLSSPADILQKATEAGSYAVDKLCNQTLFTGEFADRASKACELRDQTPSVDELIGILQGLDGLPDRLATIDGNLFAACASVNQMLEAPKIDIPRRNVTIFEGGALETTFTAFPGFERELFPSSKPLSFCS